MEPRWSYRVSRKLDGMRTADAAGRRMRVFGPPWWRVDRWVRFLFAYHAAHMIVTFQGERSVVLAVGCVEASRR